MTLSSSVRRRLASLFGAAPPYLGACGLLWLDSSSKGRFGGFAGLVGKG